MDSHFAIVIAIAASGGLSFGLTRRMSYVFPIAALVGSSLNSIWLTFCI